MRIKHYFWFLLSPVHLALASMPASLPSEERCFYFGLVGGWGTTDWSQLIARASDPDEFSMVSLSAPIAAHDGGLVYGFMIGYEIRRYFAWEINYMRFSDTHVQFDEVSLYPWSSLKSRTYVYNLIGKFSVPILTEALRGFASTGMGIIHRDDLLAKTARIVPTFGVGMDYVMSHAMAEFVFQYYAGFGKAVIRPAVNYIPFLYTVHLKIGYRF